MNYQTKVRAFEECLLRTCIRVFGPFYEGLNLNNYKDAEGFNQSAVDFLEHNKLCNPGVETAMDDARKSLLLKLKS